MDAGLSGQLLSALRSDDELLMALEKDWGGSYATNGLKVWLVDQLAAENRHFWCGFRGKMGAFASRRRELVAKGTLDEREFMLDLIAFDSNGITPSFGAEIEQSYAKKRDPYPAKERIFSRSVPESLIEEQKDAEFCYDFSRLLTVAPKQGVFIGLSYDYEGCLAKWKKAFESLLVTARLDAIDEITILFILTEPRHDRLTVATYGWQRTGESGFRDFGKVPLR